MYTNKVIEHFINPQNVGFLDKPDGVGSIGDPSCGDYLCIYINVKDNHISRIKFEITGCPAAIATSSVLTELAKGKTLAEANKLSDADIVRALGGLPDPKLHCSNLGTDALKLAIKDYLKKRKENWLP